MAQYVVIVFLLTIAIGLTIVAPYFRVPYPILLLVAGIFVGFIPGFEWLSIDPEVVFLIFLPPLLYEAAFKTSFKEFRNNIRTISTLAISLVFITTGAIAVVVYYCIPGMTWPLAFVLGAILSPPDAVAAAGVTKGLFLTQKTRVILEGESLVNDASALVALRFAVAAVSGASFVFWKASLIFIIALVGGCLVGIILWIAFSSIVRRIQMNSVVTVSLNLLIPFAAYLFAEELHVSGVIAVVTVGLMTAIYRNKIFSEKVLKRSHAVWSTGIFLLNGLVFILIGLEFPRVMQNIPGESVWQIIFSVFLIIIIAIAIRMAIIFLHKYKIDRGIKKIRIQRGKCDRETRKCQRIENRRLLPLYWKDSLIIGWSGMRGIVSLAAALSLPLALTDGTLFPHRDTIIFLTVVVVVIMLLVQGMGLPLLIKWMKIDHFVIRTTEEDMEENNETGTSTIVINEEASEE